MEIIGKEYDVKEIKDLISAFNFLLKI